MTRDGGRTLAGDLFGKIVEGDSIAVIRSMVEAEPRAVETGWLEFKAYPGGYYVDPTKGYQPSNLKDKKKDFVQHTWSATLSAFANTQGGVLIWGIHASKNSDGVDAAHTIARVPNPDALATRLMELHHQATDPPISGVDVRPFLDPSMPGWGFVVCYVPQSVHVPHRAEYAGKQFYMRFGDDTDVPEVSVLRRLFYPQVNSAIHATGELSYSKQGGHTNPLIAVSFSVVLENRGNGTARGVFVGVDYEFDEKNVQFYSSGMLGQWTSHGHKKPSASAPIYIRVIKPCSSRLM